MTGLIIIAALFFLMWVLLIRPQRRKQMQQRQMLAEVRPGDEIVTAGGMYGTVESVSDDELMLEIAPGTVVRLARRAVAGVFREDDEEEAEADEAVEDAAEPAPELAAPVDAAAEAEEDSAGSRRR